jgi:hypothetical protein
VYTTMPGLFCFVFLTARLALWKIYSPIPTILLVANGGIAEVSLWLCRKVN